MGRLICLMGKSASGKDTVFRKLLADEELGLRRVVPYTTRPIREGERDGVEYFFTDEETYLRLWEEGRILEDRTYHTLCGLWRYFTADDCQLQGEGDLLIIGTLEAYRKFQDYFGRDRVVPVMLELEDGFRLQRALDREKRQDAPKYGEMCRRFLADCEDFSEEKIGKAGITRRFRNDDLGRCLEEIKDYLRKTAR